MPAICSDSRLVKGVSFYHSAVFASFMPSRKCPQSAQASCARGHRQERGRVAQRAIYSLPKRSAVGGRADRPFPQMLRGAGLPADAAPIGRLCSGDSRATESSPSRLGYLDYVTGPDPRARRLVHPLLLPCPCVTSFSPTFYLLVHQQAIPKLGYCINLQSTAQASQQAGLLACQPKLPDARRQACLPWASA